MATTKDRLEQLTNVERELHDDDVVAPGDSWGADAEGPLAAAGNRPAGAGPRAPPRARLRGWCSSGSGSPSSHHPPTQTPSIRGSSTPSAPSCWPQWWAHSPASGDGKSTRL